MDNGKNIGGVVGTALSGIGAGLALDELQQILSIVATCLGVLTLAITNIIIPLIKHYKKAKEDGKITPDEIKEGVKIIENGIDDIKNHSDSK